MTAAFIMLILVIAVLPTLTVIEGSLADGFVSAVVAIALLTAALTLRTSDLNRFSRLLRPTAFILLFVPCLWMLLQVLPISTQSLPNSVWVSASTALAKPFVGAVSLDIGATLLAVVRYCTVLAAAFVSASISLNKSGAENLLSLLTGIAVLIAIELIGFDLGYLRLLGYERLALPASGTNIVVVGIVLSCAMAIRSYEHLDRTRHSKSRTIAMVAGSASVLGLLISLSAILISGEIILFVAALFGAGTLIAVLAIRTWRLGPWGRAGTGALAVIAMIGVFSIVPARKEADPTLALSTQGQISSMQRMLSDVKWTGSGAGSLKALSRIYREAGEADSLDIPTTASVIAIEMGRPFLWTSIIVLLIAAWMLFRRALLRGRDYVYPAAGAGCIIALLISSFANEGHLALTASLMIGVVCGLALAQSQSSTSRDPDAFEEPDSIPNKTNDPPQMLLKKSFTHPEKWFRVAVGLFGLFLAAQAVWMLLPEIYRPNHIRLPLDEKSAAIAFAERDKIQQAASLTVVRGDLWAEAAFTYGGELWTDRAMELGSESEFNTEAQSPLMRALRYSPHRGDVWLLFAALAHRHKWPNYQPSLLLKMSYYTAPNELALFPLRLDLSLSAKGVLDDPELEDMVRREITVVLTRAPALRPALLAAYQSALPQSKLFAERVIAEIDPRYLVVVRARSR